MFDGSVARVRPANRQPFPSGVALGGRAFSSGCDIFVYQGKNKHMN